MTIRTGMGFKYFLVAISKCQQQRRLRHGRRLNKEDLIIILTRYSWLLIIFTVANYFCLVTSNIITESTSTTTTTSSTVRPWPSHEFFQNVMKGNSKVVNENETLSETTTISTARVADDDEPQKTFHQNNNKSVSATTTANHNPKITITTKSRLIKGNKRLNETFVISSSNLTRQNDTTRVTALVKEISTVSPAHPYNFKHKKIPLPLPAPASPPTKINFTTTQNSSGTNKTHDTINENIQLTKNKGKVFMTRLGNEDEAQMERDEQRGSLKKSLNLEKAENSKKNFKNLESDIEPRRWLSLTSSTSTSKNDDDEKKRKNPATFFFLPPTIETSGGLPFRVSPVKKTRPRTELSPEFYANLASIEGGGGGGGKKGNSKDDRQQEQDYVNDDDRLEWWHAEDKEKFSPSTVKPPNFTRLTWPYNNKEESQDDGGGHVKNPIKKAAHSTSIIMKNQKQIIPFPVVTSLSSSSLKYATTMRPMTMTTTTVQPIFPILLSSTPSYQTNNRIKVKNKISSSSVHHWGSSGSQQVGTKSPTTNHLFLPAGFVRVNVTGGSSNKAVSSDHPTTTTTTSTTGIKLSADVITSTDSSVVAQLSQVLLSSMPVPGNKKEDEKKNNNFQGFGETVTGTKTPTPTNTIWYKPVINHYGSSGSSASIPDTATTSWNWNQHDHHQHHHPLDDNEKGEQIEQKKENEGSSSSSVGQGQGTTSLDEIRDEEKKKENGHILFKLWNYSNGTLQLNNQKKIPSWILKDFAINDDQILNLNELPETAQKIVENKFLTVKGKSGFYSHHGGGGGGGGFDSHWQQLPILQPEEGKYPLGISSSSSSPSYDQGGQRRRPVSLNYILWNHEDPPIPPTKSPHDFLLHGHHGHQAGEELDLHDDVASSTHQLQNYLQHFLQKPKPYFHDPSSEANWGKLESFLKQQAAGGVPYLALLESIQNHSPTQFPWSQKFEDKDISNLVAVSLILSYLNKNKDDSSGNFASIQKPPPPPPPPENLGPLHSLFSSPSPSSEKDPHWDAIRPVLQHTKPFNNNNDPSYLFSSPGPSASAPIGTKAPHQGYVFDSMTTKAPPRLGYIFDTMTTAPTAPASAAAATSGTGVNFDRFHSHEEYDDETPHLVNNNNSPTKRPSKNKVSLERGETSGLEDGGGGGGGLTKTLLEKKKLLKKRKKHKKRLKNKKGYYENFGIKLDVGTDLVAHLKDKFMALLTLQYAPIIILCMAMLGPALMIGSPYIMKAYRNRFSNRNNQQGYYEGDEVDQAHTYIYPYNYAYPVVPQTTGSTSSGYPSFDYDPYDDQYQDPKGLYYTTGKGGRGRRGSSRSRKKSNVEIHHHFHDIPIITNPTGTFSPNYPAVVQQQQQQQQFGSILDLQQNEGTTDFGPHHHHHQGINYQEQQSDYTEPLPSSSSSSLNDNDAEGYMEKIRDIGRNLGLLIGSTISDSKSDAIKQILEQWSSFNPTDSSRQQQYRDDSDEDSNFFRRKLSQRPPPPVRKN